METIDTWNVPLRRRTIPAAHELHATALGRAFWSRVVASDRAVELPVTPRLGPYETEYPVDRGYSQERDLTTRD
jgi:hypothetical protein